MRRLVHDDLRRAHDVRVDVGAVFDLDDGGPTDIASGKDHLLGEAVAGSREGGG